MKHILRSMLDSSRQTITKSRKIFPNYEDPPENRMFKTIVITVIGTVAAMIIAGLLTFVISLEGDVQTLVPDVAGTPLVDALLELQDKELQSHIQLRYSSDPATKGHVLEQAPAAGNLVRSGRRIELTVSRGAVVDTVTDFVGEDLDDVRAYLRTLSATYEPLMRIGTISYVFSQEDAGAVVQQSPDPGTQLESFTDLELIVSRGPDISRAPVPRYIGMQYSEALQSIVAQGRVFQFKFADTDPSAARPVGSVLSQEPAPGEEAAERGRVVLEIVPAAGTGDEADGEEGDPERVSADARETASGEVLGIFQRRLPEYPVRVELTLQRIDSEGNVETIVEAQHAGGMFSVPYRAEPGDTLVLSRLGNEIVREMVQEP